jgi:hypothetical protein
MGKLTITHEINCDANTFWKVFFDREFNLASYKDIGFPHFEILSQEENDKQIVRKVKGSPPLNLPGPVAKLLGPSFGYTEDGTFDKATQRWTWKMTPSTLADKLRQEGTLRIEPIGDKKVRRIADLFIEAKVFGVGGLIESSAEKELRSGWEKSAVFMNRWLAERHVAA